MELNNFIDNVASQFEDTDRSYFAADTEFKLLDEWSSLAVLLLISMIDEKYHNPHTEALQSDPGADGYFGNCELCLHNVPVFSDPYVGE